MSCIDELKMKQNNNLYFDVEIYFDNDLVCRRRQVDFQELETTIEVSKSLYTSLYYIKKQCKEWNYKVVIK